jgi:hypothetical protein
MKIPKHIILKLWCKRITIPTLGVHVNPYGDLQVDIGGRSRASSKISVTLSISIIHGINEGKKICPC